MDDGDPLAGALLVAFNALIGVAAPGHVIPVLRQAVTALLAEAPVSAAHKPATLRPLKRSRSHSTGNPGSGPGQALESWGPLRSSILAALAARGISRRELAAAVEINYVTLEPTLTPKGRAPSRDNIARLRRWLGSSEAEDGDGPRISSGAGPAGNGEAQQATALPAHKLTTAQREKLAAWRELAEERSLRAETGLAIELVDQAIAGHALAPPIVGRLVSFLQHRQPAAPEHA